MEIEQNKLKFQQGLAQAIKGRDEQTLNRMNLTRSAMIDFLSGQRLPTEDAMTRILDNLNLSEDKVQELWLLYRQAHANNKEKINVCTR